MSNDNEVATTKHPNIFAALSAFQGENPKIEKTASVDFKKKNSDERVQFNYAPLDKMLEVVRPLLFKHGLALTWEEKKEGWICAALYHETYAFEQVVKHEVLAVEGTVGANHPAEKTYEIREKNVLRSMPIMVDRKGDDMKEVGTDSTYARRYTMCEVLGIASDDDKDAQFQEERRDNAEKFAFDQARKRIREAKSEELTKMATLIEADLKALEEKKPPTLGLNKVQYDELQKLLVARRTELGRGAVGAGKPGDNNDGGGEGTLPLGDETPPRRSRK